MTASNTGAPPRAGLSHGLRRNESRNATLSSASTRVISCLGKDRGAAKSCQEMGVFDVVNELPRHRFTIAEYERLSNAGVLPKDLRTELIDGAIVEVSPMLPPHAATVGRIATVFVQRFAERATVRSQLPLRIPPRSEPQPDVLLAGYRFDFYASDHPEPNDVLLVVEVWDSSVRVDRLVKAPLYAAARIPELWIVNVAQRMVEVYREPRSSSYQQAFTVTEGSAAALAFPDVKLPLEVLVGPP